MFHNLDDSDDTLWMYLNYGGLPGLKQIGIDDEEFVWDYIKGVHSTVVLKDIIERQNIRNVTFVNTLLRYFADTIGKLSSLNNISKFRESQGI